MSSYSPRIDEPCSTQKSQCLLTGGPIGITGSAGPASNTTGPTGSSLKRGPTGPAGNTAVDGATGPTGWTGVLGNSDATGPAGPASLVMITGPAGPKGAIGDTGPVGPIGDTGPTGPIGPTGVIGPEGDKGSSEVTGPVGPTGLTGSIGPTGRSDITGPRGIAGLRGDTGPTGGGPYIAESFIVAGNLTSQVTTLSRATNVYSTDDIWVQSLIPDRDTKVLPLPVVESYFTDVSTELRNYRLTINNLTGVFPYVSYTLNYLWKSNDKILASLSRNRQAYIDASDGSWIAITFFEFTALSSNITGTFKGMATDSIMGAANVANFPGTGTSAIIATNQSNSNCPPIPANSYVYAVGYRYAMSGQTGIQVFQNTTTGFSNFTQLGGNLPTTAGTTNCAVFKNKAAFRNPIAAETLLALYTNTAPAYMMMYKPAATPPTTTTGKYLLAPGTITTSTDLATTFTSGAFAIQTLSTTVKQW